MMRAIHLRHAVLYDVANCLVDLFPSGADIIEVGADAAPALFVTWRTGGVANHAGNIAWGVHYRFDARVLHEYPNLPSEVRERVCERVRDISRYLDFNYADPLASSLLVVDVGEDVLDA